MKNLPEWRRYRPAWFEHSWNAICLSIGVLLASSLLTYRNISCSKPVKLEEAIRAARGFHRELHKLITDKSRSKKYDESVGRFPFSRRFNRGTDLMRFVAFFNWYRWSPNLFWIYWKNNYWSECQGSPRCRSREGGQANRHDGPFFFRGREIAASTLSNLERL